jgi:BirA family transcriptional regulator, biotin operon repressor / biotin---[acetyl-CoA-carboxylase] ligase
MPAEDPMGAFKPELVSAHLASSSISWSLHWQAAVGSTQDLVKAAAEAGEAEGWTLVTDFQDQGRGRLGRQWLTAPQRDLLFSVLLRPDPSLLSLLPLLVGVALAQGLHDATGLKPELKWPNDVLLAGRKLAGILLEHGATGAATLGVGVNVNSTVAEIPASAISLREALDHPVERERVLGEILNTLGRSLQRSRSEGPAWVVPAWRRRTTMLGKPISYEDRGTMRSGIAEDVERDGALRVRLPDGTVSRLYAGDVRLVRG